MNDLKTSLKDLIDDTRMPTPPTMDDLRQRIGRRGNQAHQPRRLFLGILTALVVISGVSLAVVYGPRSTPLPRSTNLPHPAQLIHIPSTTGSLVSTTFSGEFQPSEEVGVGGSLWLIHATDTGTGCEARRLDSLNLKVLATFPLSSCGFNVVAGDNGYLYFEALTGEPGTNNYMIHVEALSTTTGTSDVFAPVDMTVVGSGIGHTQLAFINGWLWLDGASELVQISPTTGAVAHTITGAPAGASLPLVSVGPMGIWLAGDSSPSSVIDLVPSPSTQPQMTALPPVSGSQQGSLTIDWMSPVDGQMWVGVTTNTPTPGSPLGTTTQQILIVNGSGTVVQRSPVEVDGSSLVQIPTGLFTVAAPTCASVLISRVDPSSLRLTRVATLPWPDGPCVSNESRPVTTAGGDIFVLNQGNSTRSGPSPVLYRFIPGKQPSSPTPTATVPTTNILTTPAVLRGDGLGDARFGDSQSTVTADLDAEFGSPTAARQTLSGNCRIDAMARWGEISTFYSGGSFVGYRALGASASYPSGGGFYFGGVGHQGVTQGGLRVGDTLTVAQSIYGSALTTSTAQGGSYDVTTSTGRLAGYLSGVPGQSTTPLVIESIGAGSVGCPADSP